MGKGKKISFVLGLITLIFHISVSKPQIVTSRFHHFCYFLKNELDLNINFSLVLNTNMHTVMSLGMLVTFLWYSI